MQFLSELLIRSLRSGSTANDDHIVPLADRHLPHRLSETTFYSVPHNRVSEALSYDKAEAAVLATVGRHPQAEQWLRPLTASSVHSRKVSPLAKPSLRGKCMKAGGASGSCGVPPFAFRQKVRYTTVKRLRPRCRRARMTACPARVSIRFRNPCSRLRGIRFGW